jgi:hypothetical protein
MIDDADSVDTDLEYGSSSESPTPLENARRRHLRQLSAFGTDPLRHRDWRWRRVQTLSKIVGGKVIRKATRFDDEHVVRGRQYKLRQQKIEADILQDPDIDAEVARMPLLGSWGDIMSAERIYVSSGFSRWALEAMVLAGETAETISRSLGATTDVVEAYENYFYDIRSRVDNETFITDELLTPAMRDGVTPADHDFFLKSIAYWYGPDVLKLFMHMGRVETNGATSIQEFVDSMRLRNVAKAVTVRQINQYTAHDVIEEDLERRNIEKDEAPKAVIGEGEGARAVLQALSMCLHTAPDFRLSGHRVSDQLKQLAGEASDIPEPISVPKVITVESSVVAPAPKPEPAPVPRQREPEVTLLPQNTLTMTAPSATISDKKKAMLERLQKRR